ncbi:MAG: Uracil-DNA glycosylase [candidate division WS6 bacterium GW2011_GWC1_36_11]|uniref:Type-4 uracil-DNA glycosylase n=1 Tax=candidate division WS6 bacterium GW2011_GWC1_36_11 TaxID=1619090 RepID=A0A0G0DG69_9BACT|nr:MAG: Uracil-DNA glycosylase [candidate division WS6 bacterium GW2011_GWC1_36_11]
MKTDFQTLKELHEYYAINNRCGLKKIATQPVYEIHVPSSGIVFIGEAPGKNEDLQGKPFVGAAGKFLDKLLESIGMTREDVYVSNTVKYRPPDNREPTDEEKLSCRVWLNAELMFIKPKILIPLGRHAFGRFVPGAMISASHGQPFEHPSGIPIFAMYHPAVALYNPNLRDVLKEDFGKLKNYLDNGGELMKNEKADNSVFSTKTKTDINDILSM